MTEPIDYTKLEPTVVPHPVKEDSTSSLKDRFFSDKEKEKPKPKPKAAPRARTPNPKKGAFEEQLLQIYSTVGIGVLPFDETIGKAFLESAPECARTLDELAYQNPAVRRALTALTNTSAAGAVLFAHAPIILAMAMRFGPKHLTDRMSALAGMTDAPEPAKTDDPTMPAYSDPVAGAA